MTENDVYAQIESSQGDGHNRICINGVVTGCGKCVGYCQYKGHPGFVTKKLRKKHECIEKKCHYYVPKPKRKKISDTNVTLLDSLLLAAIQLTNQMEGMRVMSVHEQSRNCWQFNYITISNEYPIQELIHHLEQDFHGKISFQKLNYSFERCVQLILAS